MESPTNLEQQPPPANRQPQSHKAKTAAPRRRRRRAVANGAPDNCFTCSKQGESCDRRRPYCSKCLDSGRECAGYKLNLTWGVGVASRGKMRGLSLPVLGAQPAGIPPKPQQRMASSSKGSKKPVQNEKVPPSTSVKPSEKSAMDQSTPPSTIPTFDSPPPAASAVPDRGASSLSSPSSSSSLSSGADGPNAVPFMFGMPNLPIYSNSCQPIAQDIPVSEPFPSQYPYKPSYYSSPDPGFRTWPEFVPASTSVKSESEEPEEETAAAQRRQSVWSRRPGNSIWTMNQSPSYSQLLLARSVGRTPRLKYLISYYAEVIAPVIIAFDGSTNPFRHHMLRLAEDSEALQEAIATLSSSNLKERRDRRTVSTGRTLPSRMSSVAHRALTEEGSQNDYSASDVISREVLYHRAMAVKLLNADLADPRRRLSDSVLGALLILCLFHACDTGVAKYKTHFAGVRKLLALRMRSSKVISEELKWFIRMFTFYDTITAAMNDREVQLQDSCLDISAMSDSDWPLEVVTGCDAGLFRMVAQVGRLNLLSQNKQMQSPAPPDMFMPMAPLPPSMLQYASPTVATAGYLPGELVNNYGFSLPPSSPPSGVSTAFWTEWFSLRQKLESWRLDPSLYSPCSNAPIFDPQFGYLSPPTTPSIASENLQDVFHISESFRHAAILYCERLAYPHIPSSDARFQSIVRIAMHHISEVQSDVYLLWPVFIAGSECVDESHRAAIRHRCNDISKDSGFSNNLSCLAVLEKVWAQNLDVQVAGSPWYFGYPVGGDWSAYNDGSAVPAGAAPVVRRKHGFTWHDAMREKRADGEYLVV